MSSETITRNDLKAVLDAILPNSEAVSVDAGFIKAENASLPTGTTDTLFNPTSCYASGKTFSVGSNNRIVVNERCVCAVITSVVFNAISATSSIKVVGLGKNSTITEQAMCATGYPTTWESISALDVINLAEGDELHFTGRCNSGTATMRQANIALIRIA